MTTEPVEFDIFAAVASPIRRALLEMLKAGERLATQLADQFALTQPAISQQLRLLRGVGLVGERRLGRQRLYHLNPGPLKEVADWVHEYEQFWHDRLGRLGAYVDRSEETRKALAGRRVSSGGITPQKGGDKK